MKKKLNRRQRNYDGAVVVWSRTHAIDNLWGSCSSNGKDWDGARWDNRVYLLVWTVKKRLMPCNPEPHFRREFQQHLVHKLNWMPGRRYGRMIVQATSSVKMLNQSKMVADVHYHHAQVRTCINGLHTKDWDSIWKILNIWQDSGRRSLWKIYTEPGK